MSPSLFKSFDVISMGYILFAFTFVLNTSFPLTPIEWLKNFSLTKVDLEVFFRNSPLQDNTFRLF